MLFGFFFSVSSSFGGFMGFALRVFFSMAEMTSREYRVLFLLSALALPAVV